MTPSPHLLADCARALCERAYAICGPAIVEMEWHEQRDSWLADAEAVLAVCAPRIRAEAMEEAAKYAETDWLGQPHGFFLHGQRIARGIRDLASTPGQSRSSDDLGREGAG